MPVNDASLVIGLKDEITGGLTRIVGALERYNTATGNSDKATIKLEAALAKASASMNETSAASGKAAAGTAKLTGANDAAAQSATRLSVGQERMAAVLSGTQAEFVAASAAVAAYKATLESVGPVAINKVGKPYSPATGRMVSAANVTAASTASANLPAAEERLTAAGNARLAASTRAVAFANDEEAASARNAAGANSLQAKSLREVLAASASTRYALYSVSQSLATVGAGMLALPILSAIVASTYQRDFATVERATLVGGKRAQALKADLIDLSEQIPISFKDITNIAAAGAQLGINPSGLVEFTRVVSQLTATTNLTADGAEQLLGKFNAIAGLGVKDFGKLASAVLNVGVHSAATEQQIAHIATQIVGIGREAGFTVPQIIGLSGAIASVSSNGAALARGATTRFITQMQKAVANGGSALTAFATTAGVSTDEVRAAFGTERFEPLFVKFIGGLSGIQDAGGNANAVLAQLGITSVRDVPLLLNLANGHKTLEEAMRRAAEGYANQDILAVHYAKINDTLVSKVKELGNTFLATLDQMGGASTGPLMDLADMVQGLLQNFGDFAKTADGQNLVAFGAVALVVVGVLALLASGLTKGVAVVIAAEQAYTGITRALAAYSTAQEVANAASATGARSMGILGQVAIGATAVIASDVVIQSLLNWSRYMSGARTSTDDFSAAIKGLDSKKLTKKIEAATTGAGPGILGASMAQSVKVYGGLIDIINKVSSINPGMQIGKSFDTSGVFKYKENVDNLDKSLTGFASTEGGLGKAQYGFLTYAAVQKKAGTSLKDTLNSMPLYKKELEDQARVAGVSTSTHSLLKLALGSTGEELVATAGKAEAYLKSQKKQLDYSKQLQDATGMDAKSISKYGDAYAKSVDPLVNFNSVTKSVQDGLQANAQAQTDAYNATLKSGDAQRATTFYYDGAAVSLDQYTAQLNTNNGTQQTWLQNLILVSQQGGAAGEQMASQFIAAGYSATSASILQQLVDATPEQRDAYIAAQQEAINLSSQAAAQTLLSAGGLVTANGGQVGADTAKLIGDRLRAGFSPETIMKEFNLKFNSNPLTPTTNTRPAESDLQAFQRRWAGTTIPMTAVLTGSALAMAALRSQGFNGPGQPHINVGQFADGGYTGPGAKHELKGVVHGGEFVFTKEATSRIGVANLYSQMRGQKNARGYATGGYVGTAPAPSTGAFSTLDASALQAILALADRPIILYTNDRSIAESASRGSAELANRGTR